MNAGWWRLEDKIGLPLDAIHTTGSIPHCTLPLLPFSPHLPPARTIARTFIIHPYLYPNTQLTHARTPADEEKLQPSLTRFFRRLTPDSPVSRNNWLMQVLPPSPAHHAHALEELAWAEGGAGPEDTFRKTPRPAPPPPIPERMRLRVEHQTLRRLPRSGAVVFTIRVYLTPLAELGHGEAGRLAAALRGVKEQDVVYRYVGHIPTRLVLTRHCAGIGGSLNLKMRLLSGWIGGIWRRPKEDRKLCVIWPLPAATRLGSSSKQTTT